jgi:hypothetical protein
METFKIAVNKEFMHLTGFVETLPMQYDKIGNVINSSRNEIKIYNHRGEVLVIKYFRKLSLINKIFFTLLGITKAKNAYEHACILTEHRINTPKPVGYIDCYKNFFINRSFFISLYTDYTPVKELFRQPAEESVEGLKSFARFTYRLHSEGIFPGDFNDSNILLKNKPEGIDFQLIDINRMKFGRFTFKKGLKNIQRLQTPPEKMGIIATEYARMANEDAMETLYLMASLRYKFLLKRDRKVKLKKAFRA